MIRMSKGQQKRRRRNRQWRDRFAAEVRELAEAMHPEADREGGACVFLTAAALHLFKKRGYRAIVQAGDMSWPIVTPEQDDGVSPTHFSYMWTPTSPQSMQLIVQGAMPEVHAWIGLLGRQELADFSTGDFPEQCRITAGLEWLGPPPPRYLWTKPPLPAGVIYTPHREATLYMMEAVAEVLRTHKEILP